MLNEKKNYFVVSRNLLNSSRWLDEPFTRGQAWIDLFGLAQHTDSYFRVRGIKVELKRGQLGYSQLTLCKRWKWSRNKVRRYLKELENEGDLIQQNNEVTTIITIVNYDKWQLENSKNDTTSDTSEGQQKDNRRYTYNNDNKDNNDNNVKDIATTSVANINPLIELFKDINPSYKQFYSNKTERACLTRMLKEHGLEKLTELIEVLPKTNTMDFAPVITSPYKLEKKLGDLMAFINKEKVKVLSKKIITI